jgi:hypothetical protein
LFLTLVAHGQTINPCANAINDNSRRIRAKNQVLASRNPKTPGSGAENQPFACRAGLSRHLVAP